MTNRLTHRFISFLDQFESRLEVDCDRLKHQLLAQVDQQFGVLRTKVSELRGRFDVCGCHDVVPSLHLDDPPMETVSLDEWIVERGASAAVESGNMPSTSSGLKRKSFFNQPRSVNKRQKTPGSSSVGSNKFVCKHPGCGKTFQRDAHLAKHERIHLGIKPYTCSWANCRFSSEQRSNVVAHVREKHFKLPRKKKGDQLITDDRDPNEYVQVDNDLLQRRLE